MKLNFTVFFIYLLFVIAQSQDIITLKNGMVIKGEIAIVNSWGFNLKDNLPVQYKSLQTVVTNQKELVEQVSKFLPSIEVITQNDSVFILNFQNVKFSPLKPRAPETFIFNEYRIITSISSLETDRYKLEIYSIFSNYLLLKIGFGYSEYPVQYIVYKNPETLGYETRIVNRKDQIYGPIFGIGVNVDINNNKFCLTYNYTYKVFRREYNKKLGLKVEHFDDASSIEIIYQRTSIWKQLILGIGISHYFNNIDIEDNNKTTGFTLGVGWYFH